METSSEHELVIMGGSLKPTPHFGCYWDYLGVALKEAHQYCMYSVRSPAGHLSALGCSSMWLLSVWGGLKPSILLCRLNILEAAIKEEGWRFCRIDGSVASTQEREVRKACSAHIPVPRIRPWQSGLASRCAIMP